MTRTAARAELEDFERQVLSHSQSMLAVAGRLTRSRAEAEDLVQDTLVKALRARDQYEPGTNLKGWLHRILRNTFINRFRRVGLERSVIEGPNADPLADGWIGNETLRAMRDPESQALRPLIEREIVRALDAIPEEFRSVVVLSDVEELSYREIAEVLQCPIGTVMSRLYRGRRLLKASLIEHARMLGLAVDEPEEQPKAKTAAPIELEAYRVKRSGR